MTDNDRLEHMDKKLDDLIQRFTDHAMESVEIRVHVSLLKKIVYGAVTLAMTAVVTALYAVVIKQ